jgi:hypothetical protein
VPTCDEKMGEAKYLDGLEFSSYRIQNYSHDSSTGNVRTQMCCHSLDFGSNTRQGFVERERTAGMLSNSSLGHLFRRCVVTGKSQSPSGTSKLLNLAVNRVWFSSVSPPGPQRSVPQYTIFGENTMLSFKVIPPTLRCLRNGALVVDSNKKGRILLEWAPRNDGGEYMLCGHGSSVYVFVGGGLDCIPHHW